MKRAAIYARISTVRQDEGMQLEDLREMAKRRKWEIIEEYVDRGVSGTKESREALDRMMADAKRGKFDIVMVWKFVRFARSLKHLVTALEEFRELGIQFVSHQEAVDTSTPLGRAMFGLIGIMAEFERELINERVFAGLAQARRNGVQLGRRETEFDEAFAVVLRHEGKSWRKIAELVGVSKSVLHRRMKEKGVE